MIKIAEELGRAGIAEPERYRDVAEFLGDRDGGDEAVLAERLVAGPFAFERSVDARAGGAIVLDADEPSEVSADRDLAAAVEGEGDLRIRELIAVLFVARELGIEG